jgi:hypothetical protein
MRPSPRPWPYFLSALAGLCDTTTGALLVAAPQWTLRLMRVPAGPTEPIWLRFIGAFVGGIGLAYLLPLLERRSALTDARLVTVLLVTAIVRLCVAGFVATAVLAGALARQWSSVWIADLALAVGQIAIVRSGALSRHA